jgi:hypothetical protein
MTVTRRQGFWLDRKNFSVFIGLGLSGVIYYRLGSLAAKTQGKRVKDQEELNVTF